MRFTSIHLETSSPLVISPPTGEGRVLFSRCYLCRLLSKPCLVILHAWTHLSIRFHKFALIMHKLPCPLSFPLPPCLWLWQCGRGYVCIHLLHHPSISGDHQHLCGCHQ
jgi:hypothetical protein